MSGTSFNDKHPYWGSFATTSDLPNVSGADVQSAGLEVGDFAFCIADSTHYKCTTATPGAGVWAAMGGGSSTVPKSFIVVGNSTEGDTTADCDYLDTGNGAQLAAAIAVGVGKTIFIRPGVYDFSAVGAPSTPITVDRCRLIGAGPRVTFATPLQRQGVWLHTKTTGNLRLFDFSSGVSGDPATDFAGMENIRIQALPPTGAISGSSFIYRGSHKNVYIHLNTGTSGSYQWDDTHIVRAASLIAMFEEPYHAEDCYATTAPYNFNYWVGGRRISGFRYTSPDLDDIHGTFVRCSAVCTDYGFYLNASGALMSECYTSGSSSDVGGAGIYLGTSALFCRIVNGYFNDASGSTTCISVNCGYATLIGNTLVGYGYILDLSSTGSTNVFIGNTYSGGTVRFNATANGNISIGNSNGSTLSDSGKRNSFFDSPPKFSVSPIGGLMVLVSNWSGGTLSKGRVVSPSTANDNSAVLSPTSDLMPMGIVFADFANGQEGWIVIAGYADVYFDNAGAVARKDWVGVSTTTVGQCTASTGDPGAAAHWREVGHVMQARTGPGLARCIVHFN